MVVTGGRERGNPVSGFASRDGSGSVAECQIAGMKVHVDRRVAVATAMPRRAMPLGLGVGQDGLEGSRSRGAVGSGTMLAASASAMAAEAAAMRR